MPTSGRLVSGGAGFIGSRPIDRVREEGHKLRGPANFDAGLQRNVAHRESEPRFERVERGGALQRQDRTQRTGLGRCGRGRCTHTHDRLAAGRQPPSRETEGGAAEPAPARRPQYLAGLPDALGGLRLGGYRRAHEPSPRWLERCIFPRRQPPGPAADRRAPRSVNPMTFETTALTRARNTPAVRRPSCGVARCFSSTRPALAGAQ